MKPEDKEKALEDLKRLCNWTVHDLLNDPTDARLFLMRLQSCEDTIRAALTEQAAPVDWSIDSPSDFCEPSDCEIFGLAFVCTCSGCPEQYDVFKDGKQVAYLRLRHGYFSVCVPDDDGDEIYSKELGYKEYYEPMKMEVSWQGKFVTAAQRVSELVNAALAINRHLRTPDRAEQDHGS